MFFFKNNVLPQRGRLGAVSKFSSSNTYGRVNQGSQQVYKALGLRYITIVRCFIMLLLCLKHSIAKMWQRC